MTVLMAVVNRILWFLMETTENDGALWWRHYLVFKKSLKWCKMDIKNWVRIQLMHKAQHLESQRKKIVKVCSIFNKILIYIILRKSQRWQDQKRH